MKKREEMFMLFIFESFAGIQTDSDGKADEVPHIYIGKSELKILENIRPENIFSSKFLDELNEEKVSMFNTLRENLLNSRFCEGYLISLNNDTIIDKKI
ncbi:MAG: hypothetical protein JXR48_02690, partial [Candidatus Delongbacteria bacterium]|nr:hypothetical protein [Candidatus Delongbacteria bacterium]